MLSMAAARLAGASAEQDGVTGVRLFSLTSFTSLGQ